MSYEKDGAFVWLERNEPTFYATEAGARALDAFLEGEVGKYRLKDAEHSNTSVLTADTVDSLDALMAAGKNKKTTASTRKNPRFPPFVRQKGLPIGDVLCYTVWWIRPRIASGVVKISIFISMEELIHDYCWRFP